MPPVDAVLFDLDDTLCAYRRSSAELLAVSFERVGVEPFFPVEDYYARFDAKLGETDGVDELRAECFAEIAAERGRDPGLGRSVARAYADEREQTAVEALPGAHEVVDALAADHRLGLVTNGPREMQRTKLAAVGLDGAFEAAVYAGFETAAKPAAEPFERALSSLDVPAGRAVHVGNSLTTDVAGAHAAGLRSAWLRQGGTDPAVAAADGTDAATAAADGETPDAEPHHVLDSLSDLREPPWR